MFASSTPFAKFLIRVFGHTFIKAQSDIRQRDGFATKEFGSSVKCVCQDMFPMECIWSVAGRFLVTSSAGHLGWYTATLVGASYMESFMRLNAEPLEGM